MDIVAAASAEVSFDYCRKAPLEVLHPATSASTGEDLVIQCLPWCLHEAPVSVLVPAAGWWC